MQNPQREKVKDEVSPVNHRPHQRTLMLHIFLIAC